MENGESRLPAVRSIAWLGTGVAISGFAKEALIIILVTVILRLDNTNRLFAAFGMVEKVLRDVRRPACASGVPVKVGNRHAHDFRRVIEQGEEIAARIVDVRREIGLKSLHMDE